MEEIYTKTFPGRTVKYGNQLEVLDVQNGLQTYIFYEIEKTGSPNSQIGLFEVLINEKLRTDQQLVLDKGELSVPESDDQNKGKVNFGAGGSWLITYFNQFNQAKGFTMCGPTEYVGNKGSTSCFPLPEGEFMLDAFDYRVGVGHASYNCHQKLTQADLNSKLQFLCNMDQSVSFPLYTIFCVTVCVLGLGFCGTTAYCVCSKTNDYNNGEALGALGRPGASQVQDHQQHLNRVRHEPSAAELERIREAQNKKKLILISKRLKRYKFSTRKEKDEQDTCAICVEDFAPNNMVRETPCSHLFHDECLMKWVETKMPSPDCPSCRAEIKLQNLT